MRKAVDYLVWIGGFYAVFFLTLYGVCGKYCGGDRWNGFPDSAPYTVAGWAFVIWLLNEEPKHVQRKTRQASESTGSSREGEQHLHG